MSSYKRDIHALPCEEQTCATIGLNHFFLLHEQGKGNVIGGWAYASRVDGKVQATCFNGSAAPNYAGFSYLGLNIELTFESKKATWPVERTLLVTGALDALMSAHDERSGQPIETPHLASIAVSILRARSLRLVYCPKWASSSNHCSRQEQLLAAESCRMIQLHCSTKPQSVSLASEVHRSLLLVNLDRVENNNLGFGQEN